MNTGTSTSFAEQEAAAMEKNREAFMALWNEYVKGRKGDKATWKKPAFSRRPRPRNTTEPSPAGCATIASTLQPKCWACWRSTSLKTKI